MKFSTIVLCFATAAIGMPAGADVGVTAADKQLGAKDGAAGANKGTPAASGAAHSSTSSTSSAAVPSATGGKGKGNGGNNKGGNGNGNATGPISESAIPDYGLAAGVPSRSQPGSCVGANNINIPCACPPSKAAAASALTAFVARGRAGRVPVAFPGAADTSLAANRARVDAVVNTLQNFNFDRTGRAGDGCPAASFPALAAVQRRLQAGENVQVGAAGGAAGAGAGATAGAGARQQRRRRMI